MMILEAGKICPHSNICPHNKGPYGSCWGTRSDRTYRFECAFVSNGKILNDTKTNFRNPQDQTGKMKVIME